jgi:hypothetical protein
MVDGLHIHVRNRTKKLLAMVLSGVGRGLMGRNGWVILPIYNISLFGIVTMNPSAQ